MCFVSCYGEWWNIWTKWENVGILFLLDLLWQTENVIQNVVHIHSINLGMKINVRNHVRITTLCSVHAQSRLGDEEGL